MVLTAAIWGSGFVVVKNSLDIVPPIYMLAFRFTAASIALCAIFCKKLRGANRSYLFHGGVLGLFLFLAYAFQTVGCVYTTAGKNALLTTIYVVLVPLIVWVLYKKKPGAHVFAAALLAFAGIALLSLQGDLSVNIGDALTLVCGFFYAVHIVFIEKYTRAEDPILLTVLQLAWAAVFSWVVAPLYDGVFPSHVLASRTALASMLYLGLACTMVTFFLQNLCQKYTASSTAALLLSLESVFGAAASAMFLGERMTPRMIAGCVILFCAIALAEIKVPWRKKRA